MPPRFAFPEWHIAVTPWTGTNAWPQVLPHGATVLEPESMDKVEHESDEDGCTVQNEFLANVEHEGEQNGSASLTQLDVEAGQDGMETEAKRPKVCQATSVSEIHKDVPCMDDRNTFVELSKFFNMPRRPISQTDCYSSWHRRNSQS